MKKQVFYALLALGFISCGNETPNQGEESVDNEVIQIESSTTELEKTIEDINTSTNEVQSLLDSL